MRKVVKDLTDLPDIFRLPATLSKWEEIAKGRPELISDETYKGTYKDSEGKSQSFVRDKLNRFYHNKCAYCETYCKAEIEHYRPKKKVKEDNGHEGYYWLCYEWSNLLPSCRYCNTEGGKGNQFPISGTRIYQPSFTADGLLDRQACLAQGPYLFGEGAYLLHPEMDDPKEHLEFCWDGKNEGIRIKEKNGSEMGKRTIQICNLNRQNLRVNRLAAVLHPFKGQIDLIFSYLKEKTLSHKNLPRALIICFQQLDELAADETLTHSLLRWYLVSSVPAFEALVTPYLTSRQGLIVAEAFKSYKNGNL